MPTAEAPALRTPALVDLTLAPRAGRTRLTRVETRPPLMVQRALYLDQQLPDQAWVFLANPAAGLLAGDKQEIRIRAMPGARAHLTTQAATKVFSMPVGSAHQRIQLTVDDGAVLEYMPGPVIPFRDADFEQHLCLTIAKGATAIVADIIAPGRIAHGECLAYRRLRSSMVVERPNGPPMYVEAFTLEPRAQSLNAMGSLGPGDGAVLATLVAVGPALDPPDAVEEVRQALVSEPACGVAALPGNGGLVIKALAPDISAARAVVRRGWSLVRRRALGTEPPMDRRR